MQKFKKFTCLLLAAFMVISLVGCGKTSDANNSQPTQDSSKPTQATVEPAKDPIKLTLWDYMASEEDSRALRPVLENWKNEYPNIKIERDFVGVEDYKIKLKTAISGNAAPDIFISWGGGFSKPFIDAGKVLKLDDYLSDNLKGNLIPAYQEAMTYNGSLYGLSFNGWVGMLFCNKEIFDQNNIKIPETYAELLDAVKALRAKKINPLAVGVNETWTAAMYHNMIALRTAGADACFSALTGTGSFDIPEIKDSITKMTELVKADAFMDGAVGLNYDEIRTAFKQGQVAMMFGGSWFAGECEASDSPVKGKIVPVKFPVIEGGKGIATEYLGGSIDCFMVSGGTKYPTEAVKALEYICYNHSREGFYEGLGMPVYIDTYDNSRLDRVTAEINDITKDATKFHLAWDTILSEENTQVLLEQIADIFTDKTTPDSFAQKMQSLSIKK